MGDEAKGESATEIRAVITMTCPDGVVRTSDDPKTRELIEQSHDEKEGG